MYTPPPAQPPIQAYGQPAAVPVVASSSEQHGEGGGESKVKTMGSKFGKQVGTAAMWGFGATSKSLHVVCGSSLILTLFFFHYSR